MEAKPARSETAPRRQTLPGEAATPQVNATDRSFPLRRATRSPPAHRRRATPRTTPRDRAAQVTLRRVASRLLGGVRKRERRPGRPLRPERERHLPRRLQPLRSVGPEGRTRVGAIERTEHVTTEEASVARGGGGGPGAVLGGVVHWCVQEESVTAAGAIDGRWDQRPHGMTTRRSKRGRRCGITPRCEVREADSRLAASNHNETRRATLVPATWSLFV